MRAIFFLGELDNLNLIHTYSNINTGGIKGMEEKINWKNTYLKKKMAWKSTRKKAVMMSSLEPPGWQWNAMHYFFIITTAIVQFLFNVNQLVLFLGNKYNILFSKHALSFFIVVRKL